MLQNTITTCFVPLLDLPTEIHHRIKEFLGPKHALIPAHTCRTLFTIYGYDHIWQDWLQTEYQQPPLKQLSNDKFTFTTRKIYQLKIENDKGCFLSKEKYKSLTRILTQKNMFAKYPLIEIASIMQALNGRLPEKVIKSITDSLITEKIIDNENGHLLLESEIIDFYFKFDQPHIKKLHTDNILSLNSIQHLTETQITRLRDKKMTRLFLTNWLSLKEITALTSNQFYRLCTNDIACLFRTKLLSLEALETLPDHFIHKLSYPHIHQLFLTKLLSIEDVMNLTTMQLLYLNIDYIYKLFTDKLLSLQNIEMITYLHLQRLQDPTAEQLFRSGLLTFDELKTYPI